MNVPEWLAMKCFLWTRKQMFILMEQLVFAFYFVSLFCSMFFLLCVVLSEFIKWRIAEQQRWLVDFDHVHVMNFWIRNHVKLRKNTKSKAMFCFPMRWFLYDNWAMQRLFAFLTHLVWSEDFWQIKDSMKCGFDLCNLWSVDLVWSWFSFAISSN